MYDGMPVPGSAFNVNVTPGFDASRVRAYGPGLEGGFTNEPQRFTIDLDGAGQGGLGLALEGPDDPHIQCIDNKDGTCSVEYTPTKAGDYDMFITFNDMPISSEPFFRSFVVVVLHLRRLRPIRKRFRSLLKASTCILRPNEVQPLSANGAARDCNALLNHN